MAGQLASGATGRPRGRTATADTTVAPPRAAQRELAGFARIAGLAGIVFSGLFVAALLLVHRTPTLAAGDSDIIRFYTTGDHGLLVTVGVYLVPFAGIAFLWYLIAFRALVEATGRRTPELARGLHLASGIGFVVMLFAGAASAGTASLLVQLTTAPLPPASDIRILLILGYGLFFVYGIRMSGMFMITTTTLARAAGLMPMWLVILSYIASAVLLFTATFQPAIVLVMPGWVILASLALLVGSRTASRRAPVDSPPAAPPADVQE